jgi:hypothetical protein
MFDEHFVWELNRFKSKPNKLPMTSVAMIRVSSPIIEMGACGFCGF